MGCNVPTVWIRKKRYKRKTKDGVQTVKSHYQRYVISKTKRDLLTDTVNADQLVISQISLLILPKIKKRKKTRKKKGKRK